MNQSNVLKLLLLGVALFAAGCGSVGVCRSVGTTCSSSLDCCGLSTCQAGVCSDSTTSTCKPSGTSCSSSTQCCGTNTCNSGTCGAAICGGIGETCVSSYDCCGTLVCDSANSGTCRSSAACVGAGSSCNNSYDCCGSLYCDASGYCSSGGSTSTLTINFKDDCYNGEDIRYKFWDVTTNGVWPSTTTSYIASAGTTYKSKLLCTTGDNICVGARQTTHGLFWGVDTDKSERCTDCCYTCATNTVTFTAACH